MQCTGWPRCPGTQILFLSSGGLGPKLLDIKIYQIFMVPKPTQSRLFNYHANYEHELANVATGGGSGSLQRREGVEVETQSGNTESWRCHCRALPRPHRLSRRSGCPVPCGGGGFAQ